MNNAIKKLSALLPSALLFACFSACASGGARQSEASSGMAAPDAAPVGSEDADSHPDAPEEQVEAQEARPAGEMKQSEEESAPMDEADLSAESGEPSPTSPPSSEHKQEKKKVPLTEHLRLHVLDFDKLLGGQALSCDGAKPHQDAICSIAERICELESPSTTRSADCSRAQESCEKARKQYQKKCS